MLLGSAAPGQRNFNEPSWDQSKFLGRLRYFMAITNPLKAFASNATLYDSKRLLELYSIGKEPDGTSMKSLRRAQSYYGSAFHPDTGQLQTLPGRMCFNAWGGTILCGAMMVWYRSTGAVMFWQWANQSFNAVVNYTNRNALNPLSRKDLIIAYASAVTGALSVAVGMKYYLAARAFSPLLQRFVPLVAVAVANAINIPLTRQNELRSGLSVTDERGEVITKSKLAAYKAISLVVISRNVIVAPSMLLTPAIMNALEKQKWFTKHSNFLSIPVQLLLTFVLYGSMVPVGCAMFPQINSVKAQTLKQYEPSAYEELKFRKSNITGTHYVYFNKGL